ncbi:MAG: LacI family DNA-binding transcriptional regulator [Trueperaceae bacterium]|nr:LacI family DNA-binding transcriptional regulator [Trueperaceae bacterium]
MATIREVSRLARVSPATVSRVLNGTTPVAPATKERVLEAIANLQYKPNAFARGLATNRSGGIGITVNQVSSPYFGAFIEGVEQVAREAGLHLMVSSGFAHARAERDSIDFLLERRCDGLVVQAEALSDDDLIDLVQHGPAPVVVFGRRIAEIEDSCVVTNNELGGALATEYLIAHGHRRIGHVTGPLSYPDARDRLTGYRRALEAAGIAYDDRYVVESTFLEEGGAQAVARLLARALEFTAIFFANDQMAAGGMRTLREHGREIPDDVSVVGYDDVFLGRYLTPTLTTVRQPLVDMGRAAAYLLLERLGHDGREVVRRFDPELVERQSVARVERAARVEHAARA